jgi:hypothetical protein
MADFEKESHGKYPHDEYALFDERGVNEPTLFVLQVNGIDVDALWKDDSNHEPLIVTGGPDASLVFFKTAPALHYDKQPDRTHGTLQTLTGAKVSLKRRSNTTRWDRKPNLVVALDADESSCFPMQLSLTNCIRDPSYERMRLASALLTEARCPTEPSAYAELTLNGRYQGTYVAKPCADEYYFHKLFPSTLERAVFRGQYGDLSGGATLAYRGPRGENYFVEGSPRLLRTYEPRLGTTDQAYETLARFIDVVNNSGEPESVAFATALGQVFDVATFLRAMAVINLIGAWDNYYLNAQNYLLEFDLAQSFTSPHHPFVNFCAYDVDSGFGVSWPGQQRNWHAKDILFRDNEIGDIVLVKRALQNERFRRYYCDFMAWFLETRFTTPWVARECARYWRTLEHSVYLESATPYGIPDTQRPWTNDDVYRHAVLDIELNAYGSSLIAGLEVMGIAEFVRRRRETALSHLAQEALGKSGVDFDSKDWSLP